MRVVYKFIQLLLLRNYVALSYVTSYLVQVYRGSSLRPQLSFPCTFNLPSSSKFAKEKNSKLFLDFGSAKVVLTRPQTLDQSPPLHPRPSIPRCNTHWSPSKT